MTDARQITRVRGVSRVFDNDRALLLSLDARPSDDEIRALHERLREPAAGLDAQAAVERARAEERERCAYLERVVANVAPEPTKPLAGDLIGLCTQVDNLMCWVRDRARAEERAACRAAVGFAAWRHEGDDARSAGMDEGARHQVQECVKAIDALGPTSDAIASARAAAIEECARIARHHANDRNVEQNDNIDRALNVARRDEAFAIERDIRALAKKEG